MAPAVRVAATICACPFFRRDAAHNPIIWERPGTSSRVINAQTLRLMQTRSPSIRFGTTEETRRTPNPRVIVAALIIIDGPVCEKARRIAILRLGEPAHACWISDVR